MKCPDYNLSMTQHTLKYIHKKRGYCKGVQEPIEEPQEDNTNVEEPPGSQTTKTNKTNKPN